MEARPIVRLVREASCIDPDAICVTLFADGERLMAWFIGPLEPTRKRVSIPYLPKSMRSGVASALVTAMGRALVSRRNICIFDPDCLWSSV